MIKTILFDVDGTIIDTQKVVLSTFKEVINEYLHKSVNTENLTFALGIPGKDAIRHFINDEELINIMSKKWSEKASERANEYTLFDNVYEAIKVLFKNNITLGVVTSKTRNEYVKEVCPFQLDRYFDLIVTASDTINHKPNPEPLNFAIDKLGVNHNETLYVGDTKYDMLTANAANVEFALANWGAHEELSKVNYKLNDPMDLIKIITKNKE